MLIITWLITFIVVVGIGVYAGTKIKSSNQWSGGDRSLGVISLGCVFAAWQIGGMAIVGAAQNGYNIRSLVFNCWFLLLYCSSFFCKNYQRKNARRICS